MATGKANNKPTQQFREKTLISHQFVLALNHLMSIGAVKSKREFANRYGYDTNNINMIEAGRNSTPHILLEGIVKDYFVNPGFLFGQSGKILIKKPVRKIVIIADDQPQKD